MSNIIDLSAGWVAAMIPRLFRLTDGTTAIRNNPASSGLLNSGGVNSFLSIGYIYLMKGVIPSTFVGITTFNTRSSDALCKFKSGNSAPGNFLNTQTNVNPVIISTEYVTAIASGLATWFWLVVIPNNVSGSDLDPAATIVHSAYGTVGITGSGSDLELPDTNIVSGQQYRISGMQLRIPTTWTY